MRSDNTASYYETQNQATFRPYWLEKNSPAYDVTSAPARPLYEALAGVPMPEIDVVKAIAQTLRIEVLPSWILEIEKCFPFIQALNGSEIHSQLSGEIIQSIRNYDGQKAAQLVYKHMEQVATDFASSIETTLKNMVESLPLGQSIWEMIERERLYGVVIDTDGDDGFQLALESCQFFHHVYAEVNQIPEAYRPYYAQLLSSLLNHGLGAFQHELLEFEGALDAVSADELKQIQSFVEKLSDDEDQNVEVLNEYVGVSVIETFIENVEEMLTYGEDIKDMLMNDSESAIGCFKEGVELLIYAGKVKSIMVYEDTTIEGLLCLDDPSPYVQFLKAVAGQAERLSTDRSALLLADERLPFGVIVSVLTENDISDDVERKLQSAYEHYCNAGEDAERWNIDLKNPNWKEISSHFAIRTGLAIALIEGMNQLQNVA